MPKAERMSQMCIRDRGWGGLSDAFDPEKTAWALEYAQLKELLTPEEYAAARSSTLNAHYTSPTVIQAIYEAVSYTHLSRSNEMAWPAVPFTMIRTQA